MKPVGTYQERSFPAFRKATVDTLELGRRKHHVPFLLEIDVTEGRRRLGAAKARDGQGLSFTAWVMKCIGQAVSEHKPVHALRRGRRRLVIFDDVDVSVLVERSVGRPQAPSDTLPMPRVIRKVNEKSVREIHLEIRAAQEAPLGRGEVHIGSRGWARAARLFVALPRPLRNLLFWRRLARNPFLAKKAMGTVVVTSIGSAGKGGGQGWAIPLGLHPLMAAVGGIARKPGVVGEAIVIREYLGLTLLFDHDVTDGAPVARFVQRLKELMETGYGLEDGAAAPADAP